jgi:hypothetical protein
MLLAARWLSSAKPLARIVGEREASDVPAISRKPIDAANLILPNSCSKSNEQRPDEGVCSPVHHIPNLLKTQ